jgi:hypothetical protein
MRTSRLNCHKFHPAVFCLFLGPLPCCDIRYSLYVFSSIDRLTSRIFLRPNAGPYRFYLGACIKTFNFIVLFIFNFYVMYSYENLVNVTLTHDNVCLSVIKVLYYLLTYTRIVRPDYFAGKETLLQFFCKRCSLRRVLTYDQQLAH